MLAPDPPSFVICALCLFVPSFLSIHRIIRIARCLRAAQSIARLVDKCFRFPSVSPHFFPLVNFFAVRLSFIIIFSFAFSLARAFFTARCKHRDKRRRQMRSVSLSMNCGKSFFIRREEIALRRVPLPIRALSIFFIFHRASAGTNGPVKSGGYTKRATAKRK